jgi:predicted Na+-dependent transporter
MGCMPGGTTSNIFVYFSKGRLSLSILMTVCSTLMAVVMVPLTISLYGRGIEGDWVIPASEIIKILFVLLIPTMIGIAIRKKNANVGAVLELMGGVFGVFVIIFLLASWIPRNWALLMETGFPIYFASIALGLIGFGLGYFLSRNLRLDPIRARTISMETGIQNGPLAILIVAMVLEGTTQQLVMLIPILYSVFIVMTSTMIMFWYQRITKREQFARDNAKIGAIKNR